jgi:hypothetical protein
MTDDDFARVVGDKEEGKEEKRRRKKFVIGEKLIRIFLTNQRFYPILGSPFKISFLSFLFLLIGRDHPPTRPGRSSTQIFILRTVPGALWEGPGDLSHCLPVISGPPARKVYSSPCGV